MANQWTDTSEKKCSADPKCKKQWDKCIQDKNQNGCTPSQIYSNMKY